MATTSAYSEIPNQSGQSARPFRSSKEQIQMRPGAISGTDFLKVKFAPIVSTEHPELKQCRKLEREFFNSLKYLSKFYGLDITVNPLLEFPVNILSAFSQASAQLAFLRKDLMLTIIQDDASLATIATVKTFNTKTTLYYIPCEPVYKFMQDAKKKQLAELCLSIFAYLNQIAEIPYHRQCYSYMHSMYDMLEEWMCDDDGAYQEEEREAYLVELALNAELADVLFDKLQDKNNLEFFLQRLTAFKPVTKAERDFLLTATKVFELYRDYPARSIFDSIHPELVEQDEYNDGRVHLEQYISFLWSFNDNIYDSLEDTINCELQEYGAIEEPTALQLFNKAQTADSHDFDFETRFFDVIDYLVVDLRELTYNNYLKQNPESIKLAS